VGRRACGHRHWRRTSTINADRGLDWEVVMGDPLHPGIATRVRAALRGERSAADLEALRAAGAGIYQELGSAEQDRARLAAEGRDLWSAPPAVAGHLVATWNAFVLQTLGAGLLDADYAAEPGTVGYVPPVTFEQAWSWFAAAAGWLSQAQQARANPDYDLAAALRIPAALPAWVDVEPCPPAHLHAMLIALPALREHAELALYDLDNASRTDTQRQAVNRLRQVAAEAGAAAEYAQALGASPAGQRLHELIEAHLKCAVTLWFHTGQLASMPALIGRYQAKAGPARVDPETLPGGSRFDPWCLTDPRTLDDWRADPRARTAIEALWAVDPDPARTLAIQAQIQAALDSGAIGRVTGMRLGSYYFCCPWAPIYQVRRPVTINGRRLAVPQQFTFDVSGEKLAEGGQFVRRILLGPFASTTDIDYCDPGAGGHHDD
jgi:hypothetical protein